MPHCPESRFSTWHSTATLLKLSTRFSSELLLFAICGEGVVVVVAVVVVVVVANRYKVRRKINNRTKFSMSTQIESYRDDEYIQLLYNWESLQKATELCW